MYKGLNNVWMTQSLFWDMWVQLVPKNRHRDPVFTFDSDRPGLINFKRTFVEVGDVTGYQWAIQYLGSYDHWLYLMKREWFAEQYERAREELLTKMRAEAIQNIVSISVESENETQRLAASKYLAERAWEKSRVGRPEKAKGQLKKEMDIVDEDAVRMGLTVIPGGKA